MKALVVDDSTTMRKIVTRCLEDRNVEAIQAGDGAEALQMLEQHSDIALIISDLSMPNLDGFGLLEAVREKDPNLPFLVVTTETGPETAERLRSAGATRHLVKPIAPSVLHRYIDEALRGHAA